MNVIDRVKEGTLKLKDISAELKTEFFGIDQVIDRVIDSISPWYLLPEMITRPSIVNLWGLTGVGKTQLVRSLVKKLEFKSKFVEIQMDATSIGGVGYDSIAGVLKSSAIPEGEPGVLLLDEFQLFRTLDGKGGEIKLERFQDVWTLLSDGKFPIDSHAIMRIQEQIYYEAYREDYEAANIEEVKKQAKKITKSKRKFRLYPYEAGSIKKMLRLKESVQEIMQWDSQEVNKRMQDYQANDEIAEFDYTKLLIFICGNLDETFTMSTDTADSDTDADTFHAFTKKITVVDIKTNLKKRFRPEQIARFGNNHVIYPSLNKDAYTKIIEVTCNRYVSDLEAVSNINYILDKSIFTEIYANSVYPTQGTRPVFSSIYQILGQSLPKLALWGFNNHLDVIRLSISSSKNLLIGTSGGLSLELPVHLDIRTIKEKNSIDFNTMVAVHEAGHAVVYATLFKKTPLEVKINVSSFKGGFNYFSSNFTFTKEGVLNRIACSLAGLVAEELVFGIENRSTGSENDLAFASEQAGAYVRRYAFDGYIGHIESEMVSANSYGYNTSMTESNSSVEAVLKQGKDKAMQLLTDQREFLTLVVDSLLKNNSLDETQFVQIATKFVPDITTTDSDVLCDYQDSWRRFKGSTDRVMAKGQ